MMLILKGKLQVYLVLYEKHTFLQITSISNALNQPLGKQITMCTWLHLVNGIKPQTN